MVLVLTVTVDLFISQLMTRDSMFQWLDFCWLGHGQMQSSRLSHIWTSDQESMMTQCSMFQVGCPLYSQACSPSSTTTRYCHSCYVLGLSRNCWYNFWKKHFIWEWVIRGYPCFTWLLPVGIMLYVILIVLINLLHLTCVQKVFWTCSS